MNKLLQFAHLYLVFVAVLVPLFKLISPVLEDWTLPALFFSSLIPTIICFGMVLVLDKLEELEKLIKKKITQPCIY